MTSSTWLLVGFLKPNSGWSNLTPMRILPLSLSWAIVESAGKAAGEADSVVVGASSLPPAVVEALAPSPSSPPQAAATSPRASSASVHGRHALLIVCFLRRLRRTGRRHQWVRILDRK